jgi:hypothetical protein
MCAVQMSRGEKQRERQRVNSTINTSGADIHILDRPGGGYVIRQGRSHLLLTAREAVDLHTLLGARIGQGVP